MVEKEEYNPNKIHAWETIKGATGLWAGIILLALLWAIVSGVALHIFTIWFLIAIPGYFIHIAWKIIAYRKESKTIADGN